KAAQCYLEANLHDSAGRVYVKMAQNDPRFYTEAYEAFARAGKWDAMLGAAAEALASSRIIEVAYTHDRIEFFASYLANPDIAKDTIPKLSPDQIGRLFQKIPLSPRFVTVARTWVKVQKNPLIDMEVLNYVARNKSLCELFWVGIDDMTKIRLTLTLYSIPMINPEIKAAHAPFVRSPEAKLAI
ncbi:hypothetical protein E3A20_21400, partial [Planctomyces bekefii]